MKQPLPTEGFQSYIEGPFAPLQTSHASTTGEADLQDANRGKSVKMSNTSKPNNKSKTGNKSTPCNTLVAKTYKLPVELVQQIENVAYWRRKKIQDVMAEAMTQYLDTIPADDQRPIPGH